jgi:hypothetical protein
MDENDYFVVMVYDDHIIALILLHASIKMQTFKC